MHRHPAHHAIARHLIRLDAARSGRPEIVGTADEQGTAAARRMREENPSGPPPLVTVEQQDARRVRAVDHAGREFIVQWSRGDDDRGPGTVTVTRGDVSLTAPAGRHEVTMTARELAGHLAGEWRLKGSPRRTVRTVTGPEAGN
jgi:hypothetical protein